MSVPPTSLADVRAALDADRLVAEISASIRIPSVFGEEAAVAEFFAELMKAQGATSIERQEVAPGRPNIIGRWDSGRPGPTVVLQGHMDTVPPGEHPEPFSGDVRGGAIWGRGASDMKGPLVTAVFAAGAAFASGRLCGSAIVIGTVDEESEKRGIFGIVDAGIDADFGICVEPTDLRVAIAQKGCLSARVTVRGLAAHGANPELGVNAISKMARVIAALDEATLPEVEIAGAGVVRATYNVGVIEGGSMFFIVPDECSVWVDRRTVPGETHADALERLRATVEGIDPDAEVVAERQDWKWERIQKRGIGSCSVDVSSPVVRAVVAGIEAASESAAQLHVQSAWCETDFLVNDLGIPTVNFGPGRMELAHTSDERIDVTSAVQGAEALGYAVGELCRAQGESHA